MTPKRKALIVLIILFIAFEIYVLWPRGAVPIEKPEIPAMPSITPSQISWPTVPPLVSPTPTPTPTPTLNQTLPLVSTPIPTPTPMGDGGGNGGGGGGGGGGAPTPKPTPPPTITPTPPTPTPTLPPASLGLQICDPDGSNCTKEISGFIDVENVMSGDNVTIAKLIKNDWPRNGKISVQINFTEDSEELNDYLYFQTDFSGQITVGPIKDWTKRVEIGSMTGKQSLPINMTLKLLKTAGNECQAQVMNLDITFYIED